MSSLGGLNRTHTSPPVQPCTLTHSLVLLMVCTGSSVPTGAGSGGTSGGKIGLGGLWDWGVRLSPPSFQVLMAPSPLAAGIEKIILNPGIS